MVLGGSCGVLVGVVRCIFRFWCVDLVGWFVVWYLVWCDGCCCCRSYW